MPNSIDLFTQNHRVTNDPTNTLPVNVNKYIQTYPFDPAAAEAELQAGIMSFIAALREFTGIDLTSVANFFLGINTHAGEQQFSDTLTNLGNLLNRFL